MDIASILIPWSIRNSSFVIFALSLKNEMCQLNKTNQNVCLLIHLQTRQCLAGKVKKNQRTYLLSRNFIKLTMSKGSLGRVPWPKWECKHVYTEWRTNTFRGKWSLKQPVFLIEKSVSFRLRQLLCWLIPLWWANCTARSGSCYRNPDLKCGFS